MLAAASVAGAARLPLHDAIDLGKAAVGAEEPLVLTVPPLPAKQGKIVVLKIRMISLADRSAGCNFNADVRLNDAGLTRYTVGGEERLINRPPMLRFSEGGDKREFQVFSGPLLMTMFGPDAAVGDGMTVDGQGATFVLRLSDVANGVDGNTLTVTNRRARRPGVPDRDLVIEELVVGWVDKADLPAPESLVPERGEISQRVVGDGVELFQAAAGGFAVRGSGGLELLVETGLGMRRDAPSMLVAEDAHADASTVTTAAWGPRGYRTTVSWPSVTMVRTLWAECGVIEWKERWTNVGEGTVGVPFRQRLFLRGEAARIRLAGDADVSALAGSAKNPTVFLESRTRPGVGFGVTAESDWLRLLMWSRVQGGVSEVYTETLALAPGSSIDFDLTITPVASDGYWAFINSVRQRWGVNGFTVPRPIFWGYSRAPDCASAEERFRKSLGHLGPIALVLGPWMRLEPDARVVRAGRYPKLAEDAPRAPGACPDFDVGTFLTWEHRKPHHEQFAESVQALRRACPQVKVLQMMHPAMEVAYGPLHERWPYAEDVIRTADGRPFSAHHYSKAWVHDYVAKDWHVYYYSPRPGSRYLAELLTAVRRSLDEHGVDGIYCDEFSWAGRRRGYSRYDYSRWDGYSADLDEKGDVVRLKCDNAAVTESCQLQIVGEALRRGRCFLGNGAGALRSVSELPVARFVEGGNGYGTMAGGHLSTVPLVLGNFGERGTRQGVFEAVKTCLSNGCVYSPSSVNLQLQGADNFVCKLYPITVRRIGPGWIEGDERLITTQSRAFDWPGRDAKLCLLRYDAGGELGPLGAETPVSAAGPFRVEVPSGGLVIAEVVE